MSVFSWIRDNLYFLVGKKKDRAHVMAERRLAFRITVIFCQSARLYLFTCRSYEWALRLINYELDIKRRQPTVNHVITLYGSNAMWRNGRFEPAVCQGNITSVECAFILQEDILPIFSSGWIIKNVSLFIEYTADWDTAIITQDWILKNRRKRTSLASQSRE